jgi:drug/metabolite transporter (DMT)-like permease
MRGFGFLLFVAMTFCCWGLYGPVLHIGQAQMSGEPGKLSSLRPFICVGVAYFLIAVAYPLIVLRTKGESGNWTTGGAILSFAAGAIGAIGALGIILAFKFQGKPVYVMPLVFGLAPIVNTLVTMLMARTFKQASLPFYLGIVIVALGAAGVLAFKPTAKQHAGHPPADKMTQADVIEQIDDRIIEAQAEQGRRATGNPWYVAMAIAVTALCWGAYGPVLHKGQARMSGSRLRPFLCVGLAYFAIAVIAPLFLLGSFEEPGGFQNIGGVFWSLAAGAAGAIGALGIIYAFNFGGRPIFVMPLVFGLAPVVNTFTETISKGLFGQVQSMFFISLAMVIIGAVMVLVFAPRGKKPIAPKPEPA